MFKITNEQSKIIEIFSFLKDNETLAIFAYAGCGKTATLIELVSRFPNINFIYFVFNKENEVEAKRKFKFPNIHITTINSFALQNMKKRASKLKEEEYNAFEIQHILNISTDTAVDVENILNFYLNSSYSSIDEMSSSDVQIDYLEAYTEAKKFYELMDKGQIDFTHDFYLKDFQLNFDFSKLNFTALLLDEAQDTNDVSIEIIRQFLCKKTIVGDNYQQIYQFRYSSNALEKLNPTYTQRLTISFRCSEDIAKEANFILQTLRGEKHPLQAGNKNLQYTISSKACIARTNAMLIEAIDYFDNFKLLNKPDQIFDYAINVHFFLKNQFDRINEKYSYLKKFKTKKALKEHYETYNDVQLKSAYTKAARYKGYLFVLKNKAIEAAKRKDEADIILTTAHKSKGMEWDKVYLLQDFPDLGKIAKSKYNEETNLLYVAITRARYELSYLKLVNKKEE